VKLVVAYIQPERLEPVKSALARAGISRLSVAAVHGFGRQRGHTEIPRGRDVGENLIPKTRLELALKDEQVETAVEAIISAAKSAEGGRIGDGKIFILPVEGVIRIRTGERGEKAL
jgi:nitrogen regulatory protein P-II 1